MDYTKSEGEIKFESGMTTKTVSIEVLPDSVPELQEEFTIELYSPSDNVILSEPSIFNVYIVKNGDPHGVIGFNMSDIYNDTVIMNEDDLTYITDISLDRSRGYFGNVTVSWQIEGQDDPSKVFKTINGSVHFQDSVTKRSLKIELIQNKLPSQATLFTLSLSDAKGGAKIETNSGPLQSSIYIMVKDSDNAYGVINFAETLPNIVMVKTKMNLKIFDKTTTL